MSWDFSVRQRAEDRINDDQRWVAQQRLLRQGGETPEQTASATRRVYRDESVGRWLKRKLAALAGISLLLIMVLVVEAGAAGLEQVVRNLAATVVGEEGIRMVRTADSGHTVLIRWESATYRPHRTVAETRELIYIESLLTTGVLLGRLYDVVRVRFTIMHGKRILATGENGRGGGLRVGYAMELGGGFYTVSDQQTVESGPKKGRPLAAK